MKLPPAISVPREILRPKDLKCGIGTVARAKRILEYLQDSQRVSPLRV